MDQRGTLKKAVVYGFGGCMGVGLAFFVVLFAIGMLAGAGSGRAARQRQDASAPKESITAEEFDRIQIGMSMDEVANIVGSWGSVDSENSFGQGTQFAVASAMYSFNGPRPMSRAGILVQNGRVVQKHQFGLH
jgi:hypothetical protein